MADAPSASVAGSVVVEIGGSTAALEAALARARQMAEAFDQVIASKLSGDVTATMSRIATATERANQQLAELTASARETAQALAKMTSQPSSGGLIDVVAPAGAATTALDETSTAARTVDAALATVDGAAPAAELNKVVKPATATTTALEEVTAAATGAGAALDTLSGKGTAFATVGAQANAAATGVKGTSFQTANLAAQLNDIAVTLQSGQSPFLIALQQGTQINQVIGQQGARGAVTAIGAAFTSLINPVSLATIGIIAFGGTAVQAIGSLIPKTESATEALERHRQEILQIVQGYSAAEKAANDYLKEAGRAPGGVVQSNLQAQAKALQQEVEAFNREVDRDISGFGAGFGSANSQVQDLLAQFKAGTLSARDLATQLTILGNTDLGPLGLAIKWSVDQLADGAIKAANLQQALMSLSFVQAAAATDKTLEYALDQQLAGERSAASYKLQLQSITALGPAQQGQIAYQQKLDELSTSNLSHERQLQEAEQARTLAYTQAAHAIGMADQARLLSASQSIDAAQAQLDTIGMSIGATQRLTFVQQQLASAQAAAAQSGSSVSQGYIDAINRIGDAYGRLQQKIAETQLTNSLAFDQSQIGRTSGEQNVASQLFQIYGNDYSSQMNGTIANQIRLNQTLTDFKQVSEDAGNSFVRTFLNDLRNGTSVIGSFADAAVGAFDMIAQKLEQMAIDNLVSNAFGGLTSGSGGGGLSGLLGIFGLGGSGSSASAAPVPATMSPGLRFDTGGYTGPGGRLDPAGIVHRGEYVFDASSTSRIGVGNLEAMRRGTVPGFANGGLVRSPFPANSNSPMAANRNSVASITNHYHIDAKGAEIGVEEKIVDAIKSYDATLPIKVHRKAQKAVSSVPGAIDRWAS